MSATRRTRHHGSRIIGSIVLSLALATAGLASAASGSVHVKVTKKAITISGSRSSTKQVIQISYDPKTCASYTIEAKRSIQFSDLRATKAGGYKYIILRSKLHLAPPKPHYACVYLLLVNGGSVKQLAAASAKLT
jgi:hypothetical protein